MCSAVAFRVLVATEPAQLVSFAASTSAGGKVNTAVHSRHPLHTLFPSLTHERMMVGLRENCDFEEEEAVKVPNHSRLPREPARFTSKFGQIPSEGDPPPRLHSALPIFRPAPRLEADLLSGLQ